MQSGSYLLQCYVHFFLRQQHRGSYYAANCLQGQAWFLECHKCPTYRLGCRIAVNRFFCNHKGQTVYTPTFLSSSNSNPMSYNRILHTSLPLSLWNELGDYNAWCCFTTLVNWIINNRIWHEMPSARSLHCRITPLCTFYPPVCTASLQLSKIVI